jgi:hypothetical protein
MGRHQAVSSSVESPRGRRRTAWLFAAVGVGALASASLVAVLADGSGRTTTRHAASAHASGAANAAKAATCTHNVTVVVAASFAPVLRRVAGSLATGPQCVAVRVITADGRLAAPAAAAVGADAWIPDDTSWATVLNPLDLPPHVVGHVVATSPLYFVTSPDGPPLPASARSWLGLGRMLSTAGSPWHLVLADPASIGDGLAGAGGLAEAILGADGPLVSALDLFRVWRTGTTTATRVALPTRADQVGIVPEYALLASGRATDYAVIAPTDGTTLLNYTWYPTAAGLANPDKAAALDRLYHAFASSSATQALAAAGLRGPVWPSPPPPGAAPAEIPTISAAAMAAIPAHLAYHVLSTWHPELRRSNMLIVLDVSGSMNDPAPGTHTPKITLARQGITQVNALLPDSAELGLWQFGSQLAPPNDWQPLVRPASLDGPQRAAIISSANHLRARPTGTGLYDTILGAYRYQQAHYRLDMPNEVALFTDGVNEDDPDSISLAKLRAALAATDPRKRVQLSIFGIGPAVPKSLESAVTPVGGQVDALTTPDQVIGAFVHAVSGALSGVPG